MHFKCLLQVWPRITLAHDSCLLDSLLVPKLRQNFSMINIQGHIVTKINKRKMLSCLLKRAFDQLNLNQSSKLYYFFFIN